MFWGENEKNRTPAEIILLRSAALKHGRRCLFYRPQEDGHGFGAGSGGCREELALFISLE